MTGTKTLLENKPSEESSCLNCSSLKEALDSTRDTFEFQMRQLYNQISEQEIHLQEQKNQINKLTETTSPPSSSQAQNSLKQVETLSLLQIILYFLVFSTHDQ